MNRICELFNIKYPVIQGGMVWCRAGNWLQPLAMPED